MIEENYQIIDLDPYELKKDMVLKYQELTGKTLTEASPETLIFDTVSYLLGLQGEKQNDETKQNYLRYARGTRLDLYGEMYGSRGLRLSQQYSKTKMRIWISAVQTQDVVVPMGTRIFNGAYYFSTDYEARVLSGDLYVDVTVTCNVAGSGTNGTLAGTITNLVDVFPYYQKCENIEVTSGGAELETDDNYRKRLLMIPESFTNAGSEGAYRFWALSANQTITDVSITTPTPGAVDVYVLTSNLLASQSVKDEVLSVLNDKSIRPLTDKVSVKDPGEVNYSVNLQYYISKDSEGLATSINANVTAEINKYISWQKEVLGRDINPDELIKRLKILGVKRVLITSPVFTPISSQNVAVGQISNIQYLGIEAE